MISARDIHPGLVIFVVCLIPLATLPASDLQCGIPAREVWCAGIGYLAFALQSPNNRAQVSQNVIRQSIASCASGVLSIMRRTFGQCPGAAARRAAPIGSR